MDLRGLTARPTWLPISSARAYRLSRIKTTIVALPSVLILLIAAPAVGQDLSSVRQEMDDMRRQYDAALERLRQEYEDRLQRMEQRLKAAEDTATNAGTAASAAQKTAQQASEQASPAPPAGGTKQSDNAFNPAISVILNGTFGKFERDPGNWTVAGVPLGDSAQPPSRGFSLGESEVSLTANADNVLRGNLTLSFDKDNSVSVEEGYIQTQSLPYGFTAKGGRFFSGIGYLNEQHAHTWDFVDQALPYSAFLNTQYDDDGLQIRWLAPIADVFLEFGGEGFRGHVFPAAGDVHAGIGSYSTFVHAGGDIGVSNSWRAGVSQLWTNARNRTTNNDADIFTGRSNITIFDAVYKYAPNGDPSQTNFKLQGEYFLTQTAGLFNDMPMKSSPSGFYVQGVYQFMPRWATGVRYDRLQPDFPGVAFTGTTLDNRGHVPWRTSAMIEYLTSEFGRFRLQYTRDLVRNDQPDNQVLFQYTVSLGSHGAHQY
jgi:hypothetical protein